MLGTEEVLRHFCKYVYYTGAGNHWYENIYQETIQYRLYSVLTLSIYTTVILLENLAVLFGDFPIVEKNSALMFAAVHDMVVPKVILLLYHKESIRKLNYVMAGVGKKLEEEYLMKKQYGKMKWHLTLYISSVYLSIITFGLASARSSIVEGTPFYTVVTLLPRYEDDSFVASVFRVFFFFAWLGMMLPMMSADCMPIAHLISMKYKFITLRHHYQSIREEFDKDVLLMSKAEAAEKLKAGCVEGILMHQKLLFLADEIHRIFGIVMSLQVCESSAVAVLLLLRLVLSPQLDLFNALMTCSFVGSLFFLLALNLWNAGEITYQASLVSNAMFHCGWHTRGLNKRPHTDIRRLVLTGCAQAQKPLIFKAFGIQDLSYATFVSVARMTYSIFAIFYQQRSR